MKTPFIELHCVHNDGLVKVNALLINEIRDVQDEKGRWSRLQMAGSTPVEIKETYDEISALIVDVLGGL